MPSSPDGAELFPVSELVVASALAETTTSLTTVLHDRAHAADLAVDQADRDVVLATSAAVRAHALLDQASANQSHAAAWSTRIPGPSGALRVRHARWALKTATDAGAALSEDELAGSAAIEINVAATLAAGFELAAATAALHATLPRFLTLDEPPRTTI